MKKDFIKMPKSVVQLADEIKRAVDMYWNRELKQIELKELVWCWASSGKLLKADDISSSIKKIIGKKRVDVIEKLLEGYQNKF